MKYLRCRKCRTLVAQSDLIDCYVCWESLANAVPVTVTPTVEPQVRRDTGVGTVLISLLAVLGTFGAVSIGLAYEPLPVEFRVAFVAPSLLILLIAGLVLRHAAKPELRRAGKIILGTAAAVGLALVALVVVAVAGLIYLFVVCVAEIA
jgi:hypothetical protein